MGTLLGILPLSMVFPFEHSTQNDVQNRHFLWSHTGTYITTGGFEPIEADVIQQLSMNGGFGWTLPIAPHTAVSAVIALEFQHVLSSQFFGVHNLRGFDALTFSFGAEFDRILTLPVSLSLLGSLTTSRYLSTRIIFSYPSISLIPRIDLIQGSLFEQWSVMLPIRMDFRKDIDMFVYMGVGLRYSYVPGDEVQREGVL